MRIIRMEDFKRLPKKRKHKRSIGLLGGLLVAVVGFLVYGRLQQQSARQSAVAGLATEFKQFSNDEFKALPLTVHYPNTQQFSIPPPISGNTQADARIRAIAEDRGYRLTSVAAGGTLAKLNEPQLEGHDVLQPQALMAWQELKAAAQKDGIPLSILSAYRSPEYQRDLFMKRLLARGVSLEQVATAQADAQVQSTLDMTVIPGYSRHHTGYAIDLWCQDGADNFLSSRCHKWISAYNYQKAKQAGWIPSYADNTVLQGSKAGPGEYVWVGKGLLRR